MSNTTAPTAPVVSLGDSYSATEMGYDDLASSFRVEVSSDERVATCIWVESLEFHVNLDPETLDAITDEDSYLTSALDAEMAEIIKDEMVNNQGVSDDDFGALNLMRDEGEEWDEPSFAFSIRVDVPEGATTEDLSNAVSPFVAAMANVTDPGTFGSLYLFRAAAEKFIANMK